MRFVHSIEIETGWKNNYDGTQSIILSCLIKFFNDFRCYAKPFRFRIYQAEERTGQVFAVFSIIAICIACLGLLGLAAFTTEQRTKEIGIRKALGAPITGIVMMLSKEFTRWVLAANIIAWPVAYFITRSWLQSFAYRVDIEIQVFLFSAVLAIVIAFLTVGYQVIKAALANPVEALKYE